MKKNIITLLSLICWSITSAQNTFPTSGDVGIGTTNPQLGKLEIAALNHSVNAIRLQIGRFSMNGTAEFQIDAPGINSGRFIVKENGNVGIGTIAPTHKLDVRGHGVFKDGSIVDVAISTPGGKNGIVFSPNKYGNYSRFDMVNFDNASVGNRYFELRFNGDPTGISVKKGGNIGIGTTSPNEKLEVNGKIRTDYLRVDSENPTSVEGGEIMLDGANGFNDWRIDNYQGKFRLHHSGTNQFTVHSNGQVGIGTGNTAVGNHMLAVEGSIGAREIKVEASGWSDFVFEEDYDLPTLLEVEEHINEKGHLPEIPSATEVAKEGINLGEMDAKLLQKIEELTLYLIEQNKEIKYQQERIAKLENRLLQNKKR